MQAAEEIKQRTERMHPFESVSQVEEKVAFMRELIESQES
ncbi:MAG: hypothetical protein ACON4R_09895 [Akkermansiaceae bacterium]